MKKFILLSLFTITALFSIEKTGCEKTTLCCEKPINDTYSFSYSKDNNLICPRDMSLHGEYLLFKSFEKNLEYVISDIRVGKTDRNKDWNSGFRIGYSSLIDNLNFSFEADWTYLKIKHQSSVFTPGNDLSGTFLPPQNSNSMHGASNRFSCDFNTLDLMFTKPYHISRYYVSNPQIGLRASFIDQDYLVRYFINNSKSTVTLKNDQWGVGLKTAYESKFILSQNFRLFTKIAGSVLFSKFDISQNAQINPAVADNTLAYKTEDSFYSTTANIELAMGFSYLRYFKKNEYLCSLNIGYELHRWRQLNQARRFFDTNPAANDVGSRGFLSFNGFTFGIKIDF